jgi:hypothetical protein
MKYNAKNPPLVCMMTQSTCYKGTEKMVPLGVLWHSTGANNKTVKRYVQPSDNDPNREELLKIIGVNKNGNDWNHKKRKAGVNAFIGELEDDTVAAVQVMPWDYESWGCGKGSKGTCNDGWMQFEICEDNLKNKEHFEAVYKEGVELTAYYCKMYKLDPKGTVKFNGVQVPVILDHAQSHKLKLGSNHGDVLHWFRKYGKTMDDVRDDVAKLMNKKAPVVEPAKPKEIYRVRKAWEDEKSQVGAYANLDSAKDACDKAGKEYEVYNSQGVAIYPNEIPKEEKEDKPTSDKLKKGDAVKLVAGAKYTNGTSIPSWLFRYKLYVREVNGDKIVISTQKTGAVTGVVKSKYLTDYDNKPAATPSKDPAFKSYIVKVTADVLNIRKGAGTGYKIVGQIRKHGLYTIIDEKNGWGKLKSGAGWISLKYTKKI